MKKLLLSLIACGTLFNAACMNASDDLTQGQKSGATILAAMQTAMDIANWLYVVPKVCKLVSQPVSIPPIIWLPGMSTAIWMIGSAVGIGAGVIVADGCNELLNLFRLSTASEKVNKEVSRKINENRMVLALVGLFGCALYAFCSTSSPAFHAYDV